MDKNSFLIDLSESPQTDFGRVDFDQQSDDQKVFSAIWGLEGQVNNGGLIQYFASCDGDSANYAPTALKRIGALNCAHILDRALALASNEPLPADFDARNKVIDSLGADVISKFEALDAEFLDYPDNLTDLLFEFVRSRPDSFGTVPQDEPN